MPCKLMLLNVEEAGQGQGLEGRGGGDIPLLEKKSDLFPKETNSNITRFVRRRRKENDLKSTLSLYERRNFIPFSYFLSS